LALEQGSSLDKVAIGDDARRDAVADSRQGAVGQAEQGLDHRIGAFGVRSYVPCHDVAGDPAGLYLTHRTPLD